MIFLTSYLNAGLYGGLELQSLSIDGTYKETANGVTKEWDTTNDLKFVGLNIGYGYVDAFSGEVYMAPGSDFGKFGANLRYGFDVFDSNVFPHILLGLGTIMSASRNVSFSNDSNRSDLDNSRLYNLNTGFVQLGVGLSYVVKDTIEIYGDIFLMFDVDTRVNKDEFTVEDTSYNEYGYNYDYYTDYNDVGTAEHKWDTTSIGFQIGVKFHPFGSSTLSDKKI